MVFKTRKRRHTHITKKRVKKTRKHFRKSRRCKKQMFGGTHLPIPKNVSLTILSLNCGKLGKIEDMNELNHAIKDLTKLKTNWYSELNKLSDVVVLCLQETEISVVDAMAKLIIGSETNPQYTLIETNKQGQLRLGYITISIFVKHDLVNTNVVQITGLPKSRCGYGLKTIAKGFAGLSCKIYDKEYTFISAHLPVFIGIDKPNECIQNMIAELDKEGRTGKLLFLAGDLNYRTTDIKKTTKDQKEDINKFRCEPSNAQVSSITHLPSFKDDDERSNIKAAKGHLLKKRLEHDRLSQQFANNEQFSNLGLIESPITFCETCRRVEGRSLNDIDTYDVERQPSWCDRIFHDSDHSIKPGKYNSFHISTETDHDAVYQHFELEFNKGYNIRRALPQIKEESNLVESSLDDNNRVQYEFKGQGNYKLSDDTEV